MVYVQEFVEVSNFIDFLHFLTFIILLHLNLIYFNLVIIAENYYSVMEMHLMV